MELIKLRCAFCRGNFERHRGQSNEAKKFGWRQFCSIGCMANSKLTGRKLTCANKECGKVFYRPLKEIKKVQNSFCSHACSAIVNNRQREENRPKAYCAYRSCNLSIPRDQKYCSNFHSGLAHRISKKEYEKRFIEHIKTFYKKHKRIPVKREMYGAYKEARIFYGSWNKAIEAAGYTPNPVMFAQRQIANDGHECDSFAEKIIDDWLYKKCIRHKRRIPYPSKPTLTVDFVIGKRWVEFFGLAGVLKDYDKLLAEKRQLAKKDNLKLVEVYPKDLFPTNNLEKILRP